MFAQNGRFTFSLPGQSVTTLVAKPCEGGDGSSANDRSALGKSQGTTTVAHPVPGIENWYFWLLIWTV